MRAKIGNRDVKIRFGIGQGSGIGKAFGQKLTDLRLNEIERKSIANEKNSLGNQIHEMIVRGQIIGTEQQSLDGIDFKSERTKGEKANTKT